MKADTLPGVMKWAIAPAIARNAPLESRPPTDPAKCVRGLSQIQVSFVAVLSYDYFLCSPDELCTRDRFSIIIAALIITLTDFYLRKN